jgi:hypothetical protein
MNRPVVGGPSCKGLIVGWASKHGLMYEEAQLSCEIPRGWSFPHWPSFFLIDNQQGCISLILFYIMHLYSLFASLGKKTEIKVTAYISVLLVSIASYLAPSHAFEELRSLKMMFHMKVVLIFPLLI